MRLASPRVAIAAGATIVLLPQFNARHYVEAIGRFKVTSLSSSRPCSLWPCEKHAALARNRPVLGRNRAYRFRADHPIADRRDQTSFPAGETGHWLWHDGIGSDRFWGTCWIDEAGSRNRLAASGRRGASRGTRWPLTRRKGAVDSHPCQTWRDTSIFRKKPDRS